MGYGHLTELERQTFSSLSAEGCSDADVARHLGRHRSTISRERKRNTCADGAYRREKAQLRANARRRISCRNRRYHQPFWDAISERLRVFWSPEQIGGHLKHNGAASICHKTIYRHIWRDRRRGGTLFTCLRGSRKRHRKRYGSCEKRGRILDKPMIDQRPAEIESRSTLGHWEGDTMVGPQGSRHCLLTLVERKTGFLVVKKLRSRTADEVTKAILEEFGPVPHWFKSVTFDNGTEFHDFRTLESVLGTKVFFCHPHHSWERGTNENTNGLVRQYIPKGQWMEHLDQKWCDSVACALNTRPRKRLLYQSPAQIFSLSV